MKIQQLFFKKIFKSITVFEIFYLGAWSLLFILLWQNMLKFDGTYYWAGWKNIWGDWSMHFPYIYNFLYRPFPLSYHPLYWGHPFGYHFAADLLSAVLMKFGLTLVQATVIPSIFSSLLLIVTSYIFYFTLYRNRTVAALALPLFFFNGGLGFILYILRQLNPHIVKSLSSPILEFTHIEPWNIHWVNFITADFIPQRPFLFGMPITLIIFFYFWNIYKHNFSTLSSKQLLGLAIVSGLLPIIHIYSYFVILGIASFLTVLSVVRRKHMYTWLWYYVPLALVSAIVFHYLLGTVPTSYIHFNSGWMTSGGRDSFVWFWIKNIGIMSVFIPISFFIVPRNIKIFSIPFFSLFIFSNLFIFQPHEWDNSKFLLFWYFYCCGMVAYALIKLYDHKKLFTILLGTVLFYTSVASGLSDVANLLLENQTKYRLFSAQDIYFSNQIRSRTDPNSVFLMYPSNSWLGMVLGRQTVMGFEAWIDNLGAATASRKQEIEKIYRGDPLTRELLKKYHVDYVMIGPQERAYQGLNEVYFQKRYPVLITNNTTTVYNIQTK